MRKLVAAMVALVATATANAGPIINGGFETGDFTGWTQFGNTGFTGVTSFGPPHSGTYNARFGPVGSTGGISQSFLSGGDIYQISFWLTNEFSGGPSSFQALLNGNPLVTLTNPSAFGYTQYTFLAPTVAGSNTLAFSFRQDPSWFRLDDVSATATPEPISLVVFGTLLVGGAGFALRRRMSTAAA